MHRPRDTGELVEHQARWSDLRRRLEQLDRELPRRPAHGGPWLTMSRQLGAGGQQLARELAAPLGWRVVDQEILADVARRTHSSEELLRARDEHASGLFDDYLSHLLLPSDPGQSGFHTEVMRTVVHFAREGKVVLLGRGANWFLPPRCGLRVRVFAPEPDRVARVVREQGLEEAAALRRVREHDANQRAFIRQVYGRDIDDPLGYDLVVNTGEIDLALAAEIITTALRQRLQSTC
jgi:cytidylate kinase